MTVHAHQRARPLMILVMSLACFSTLASSLKLAPLFMSNMVMQRNTDITIRGEAAPQQKVHITLLGKTYQTLTNQQGRWGVTLPKQQAGGPYRLTVSTANDEIQLEDVYFGDVWLASGQSNMEWKLKWQVNNFKSEIKDSHYPQIKYFDVPNHYTATEQPSLSSGTWNSASPETSGEFSAVAWFFAKHLHNNKNIPVGIIDSTWGGTPAEAWTPLNDLLSLPGYQKGAADLIQNPALWEKKLAKDVKELHTKNQLIEGELSADVLTVTQSHYKDEHWKTTALPLNQPSSDVLWLRKNITLSRQELQHDYAEFNLGWYPNATRLFINGSLVDQYIHDSPYSAFKIPTHLLISGTNTIVIRVVNGWDNRVNIGQKQKVHLKLGMNVHPLNNGWRYNNTIESKLPMPANYWQKEGTLYNAMINPITHFPIKGVIWYQGESNINRSNEYFALFTTMIKSWRKRWQQPNLPFIFAQLASMHKIEEKPVESSWALLREAQTQSLSVPNTAMVVLTDAGEQWDIHPRNKQVVGKRMWLAAQGAVYNDHVIYKSPQATHLLRDKETLTITFENTGSELVADGSVIGFEIAGEDKQYHNAQARILNNTVTLTSPHVKAPTSVRYGWKDYSNGNLYNRAGLPAVPFRLGE